MSEQNTTGKQTLKVKLVRSVAGTREFSVPARNERIAPGIEAKKLTTTATARPIAPITGGPPSMRITRRLGMKMYAE